LFRNNRVQACTLWQNNQVLLPFPKSVPSTTPTTSYPFEKPETGKIAIKVINHYGDEVMKVYMV
jgi:hypothetical protein